MGDTYNPHEYMKKKNGKNVYKIKLNWTENGIWFGILIVVYIIIIPIILT